MKYNADEGKIYISVSELVATARRGISPARTHDEDEPCAVAAVCGETYTYDFCDGDICFSLYSRIAAEGAVIRPVFFRESRGNKPTKDERESARGEAYLMARLLYASGNADGERVRAEITYRSQDGDDICEGEYITAEQAESFLMRCVSGLRKKARAEIERVTERLPTMKAAAFPYDRVREGQREFIRQTYKTISRGGELFSEAPTGTGKTVSALFPAIRALGDGRCEKVFYFTPKTTTAKAACDCIELFAGRGVNIRAVVLISKERLCARGTVCRKDKELCDASFGKRLTEATFALFDKGLSVVDFAEIKRTAKDFGVCPHELSLCYSELCDIVICDFNYLFDPQVYIRRFFTARGEYAFLIDEAHNLHDRAREMYSASLTQGRLREIFESPLLGEESELKIELNYAIKALKKLLFPLVKDEIRKDSEGRETAAYHTKALPEGLYNIIGGLLHTAEKTLQREYSAKDADKKQRIALIRDFANELKKFNLTLTRYDDGFETFVFLNGDDIELKLFCIDTGRVIRERLALGKSAVFFSGTFAPLDYYRSVLGGDRSSNQLTLPSPFVREQLAVFVMDKISTRYLEREDTIIAVCKAIAATLSARRGNYMIFSPSFAYTEALYKIFTQKYPKIKAMLQTPHMTEPQRREFINSFSSDSKNYLVGFCVMGGIFSEGVDLVGDRLIGAVVVGIGMPSPSFEREAIQAYYDELLDEGKQYAYIYPGMNRVFQAAGRVIRSEDDRGIVVLIDDRFADPIYKKTAPTLFSDMRFLSDANELKREAEAFWADGDNSN